MADGQGVSVCVFAHVYTCDSANVSVLYIRYTHIYIAARWHGGTVYASCVLQFAGEQNSTRVQYCS